MTIQEFYKQSGSNYQEALTGLGNEERIAKYLNKFAETHIASKIEESLNNKDNKAAFMDSHNLKGMCLNVSLTKLGDAACDLTESLRYGPTGDVEGLFANVKNEYEKIEGLILQINKQNNFERV